MDALGASGSVQDAPPNPTVHASLSPPVGTEQAPRQCQYLHEHQHQHASSSHQSHSPLPGKLSVDTTNNPTNTNSNTTMANSSRPASRAVSRPGSSASKSAVMNGPSPRRASSSSYTQTSSPKLYRKSSASSLRNGQTTPTKPTLQRSTSGFGSPKPTASPTMSTVYEPPPLTPNIVAADFFKAEWEAHSHPAVSSSGSIAIIHDSCYGHRYARPKTTKNTLGLIVERPERIQAGILGLSTAYVRCGQRHEGGSRSPMPNSPAPAKIPFTIHKSKRLVPLDMSAVTNVHGTKWMAELNTMCLAAEAKLAANERELARIQDSASQIPKPPLHENDLYLCKDSLEAFQGALGGVFDGIDAVFAPNGLQLASEGSGLPNGAQGSSRNHKRAFVCIRPPGHHCSADFPSGFCWLNNVHIGIDYAAQTYGLTHAAIIDFDLHHGDGSQAITWERNAKALRAAKNAHISKKTSIGYFSIHDINSYPCEDGNFEKVRNASVCVDNAHGQSIWNVHLQVWRTEEEFWEIYENRYLVLLDKARLFLKTQTQRILNSTEKNSVPPSAAIFISAGFDASEWEGQGMQRHKVNVPTEFYARFTADILRLAEEDGTAVQGRVISVLEGGYSDRALTSGVMSHMIGLTSDIAHSGIKPSFPTEWWSAANLQHLESTVNPAPVVVAPKKQSRVLEPPTYSTPTQSFTAKVVDPTRLHRSVSSSNLVLSAQRPLTPPPPPVNWAVAAHEFGKLLIPSDRQIGSHKHEELSEPRIKRERHSSAGLVSQVESKMISDRMQLRDRKVKQADRNVDGDGSASRANRRRTISDLPEVSVAETPAVPSLPSSSAGSRRSSSRRSSLQPSDEILLPIHTSQIQDRGSTHHDAALNVTKTRTSTAPKTPKKGALATMAPPPAPPNSWNLSRPDLARATSDRNSSRPPRGMETSSTDVDQLAAGVKKITLRLNPPKPAAEPTLKAKMESTKDKKPPGNKNAAAATSSSAMTTTTATKTLKLTSSKPTGSRQGRGSRPSSAHASYSKADSTLPIRSASTAATTTAARNENIRERLAQTPSVMQINSAPSDTTMSDLAAESRANDAQSSLEPTASTPVEVSPDFVHFTPSREPFPSGQWVQPQGLTWLPPNTGTPAQTPGKRSRDDLPVFSPAGPIPFAPTIHSVSTSSDAAVESSSEDPMTVDSGPSQQPGASSTDARLQSNQASVSVQAPTHTMVERSVQAQAQIPVQTPATAKTGGAISVSNPGSGAPKPAAAPQLKKKPSKWNVPNTTTVKK